MHDPFILDTVPIVHTLCGDLTYVATFMNNPIDTLSLPMIYDAATQQYSIYTEDVNLVGTHPYTIEAFLTDYPVTATAPQAEASTIEIIDPCVNPLLIAAG